MNFPTAPIDIAFYIVSFVILTMAIVTVSVRNILKSALFLIFSFLGTAILYLLLHAEFVAIAQVMVYVGGVVIFIIFTVLLTTHLGESFFTTRLPRVFIGSTLSIAFVYIMSHFLFKAPELATQAPGAPEGYSSLQNIGLRLLSTASDGFLIPFEIISVLLLMALISSIAIARKGKGGK